MNAIVEDVRSLLKANIDSQSLANFQRFFKEEISYYGVKSVLVKKIGKEKYKQIKHLSKSGIFNLCEELRQSGIMEEAMVACQWSYNQRKNYEPEDFELFHRWIKQYITNWATCDTFCNHTVGEFVEMYPEFIENLKTFTTSDNRWLRRASSVSLIVPARKGLFLKDIFEIADKLLVDTDDLVQKGYGWMLKVASQQHQDDVFQFVMKNKAIMPRTALRYAIEKMPKELKVQAMSK